MPTVEIPLGEFLPSQPTVKNPGCVVADNVMPAEGGYAPFRGPVMRGNGITGVVRGAELLFRPDGSPFIVGGTADSLFSRSGTSLVEQEGYQALSPGESWDFAQFNNFVIATAPGNDPQYIPDYTIGATWEDLPGNPPRAKYSERFYDFLMLGCIEGIENRIQWSSYNSPGGSWAATGLTAVTNQAGYNDLNPRFGPVTALSGGRYPMVFQERAVWLMQYVGPPTIWNVSLASEDRGCIAPFSVVTVGAQTFFLSQDGFWLTNGSQFEPIGSQKVNRWFFENADNSTLNRVQGAVDWRNKCIIWAFRTLGSSVDGFDRCMIYSWEENRFSTATIQVDRLVASRVDATSLEDLNALFATLEDVTPDLDSPEWLAGNRVLAAFRQNGGIANYYTFNGDNLEATWETGFFQPQPGKRGFVTKAEGVFDATDWVMQATPITMSNDRVETYGMFQGPGIDGGIPMRADGKEMRLAVKMPAGAQWSRAVGMQLSFRTSGGR